MAWFVRKTFLMQKDDKVEVRKDFELLIKAWDLLDQLPASMAVGAKYAKSMHQRPLSYYISRVHNLGLGTGKVLDAGCGCGTWSFALRTGFEDVIGLDTSEDRIQVARWLVDQGAVSGVNFQVQSITDSMLADNSVDAVFCYSVLISAIPAADALNEFYRILKPGGCIYVQLNGIGWSYYLRDERGPSEPDCDEMGRDGLYNTICQTRMAEWVALAVQRDQVDQPWLFRVLRMFEDIASRRSNRILRAGVARINAWRSRHSKTCYKRLYRNVGSGDFEAINYLCDAAHVTAELRETTCDVAEFIKKECGEKYLNLFVHDLYDLENGLRQTFQHQWAGRGYSPDEIGTILTRIGYAGFQWGKDGTLVGHSSPCPSSPVSGTFNDKLTTWEFMARKPVPEC